MTDERVLNKILNLLVQGITKKGKHRDNWMDRAKISTVKKKTNIGRDLH